MNQHPTWLGIFLLSIALLSGCEPQSQSTSTSDRGHQELAGVSIVAGSQPSNMDQQRLLAAKDALAQRLSSRLMEAMNTLGPTAAIAVCQKEANLMAKAIGLEHGVAIGRTGVRLRNPKNRAPGWAAALVAAKTETPTFVTLSNKHAAGLVPIKLQSQCLMCHGPNEQIAPDIRTQLTKLYPDDAATGFNDGELRGWFWIEMLQP